MPDTAPIRLAVLQTVRLKGRADLDAITAALGAPEPDVAQTVQGLVDAGLLRAVATGVKPTDEGRDMLAQLLAAERDGADQAALRDTYEHFCPVNDDFKALMRDWQMLDESTPNDHSDAAYDQAIVDRLSLVHGYVQPVLNSAATALPRLASYPRRLADALGRVQHGDHSWISKPLVDSYHTVWFELHEELIGAAGLSRHDEAASGRAS